MSPLAAALVGLVVGTFVSEDLTLLTASVAIVEGRLPVWPAMAACAGGLFIGDVGLWLGGRLGRGLLARWRARGAIDMLVAWVDRAPVTAVFASRFLPGARLPLYVAAGAWGQRPVAVVASMLAAAVVWTPICVALVWATATSLDATGPAASHRAVWTLRGLSLIVAALLVLRTRRRRFGDDTIAHVRWQRLYRWEFWPAWIVNAPIVAWVLLLAIRHRSLTLFTAANPGIPDGGLVGESKATILAALPDPWVLPWVLVSPGPPEVRIASARAAVAARGWSWPMVAKPDVSQRGTAVRWLTSEADLAAYLGVVSDAVLLQVPHDGPFEAGLYYVREPGAARGQLTSITDKQFPCVVGDGQATLAALIARHPRYALQAPLFRARHAARLHRVPSRGEIVPLGRVGNHAQGTLFLDGRHLWTPELEARVDAIARHLPGLHLGRFDVRYRDRAAFMAGADLAIVELNGVAAEPTHVYDPGVSVFEAWRTLGGHWTTAFRFGAANRSRGQAPVSLRRVLALVWRHLRTTPPSIVSD